MNICPSGESSRIIIALSSLNMTRKVRFEYSIIDLRVNGVLIVFIDLPFVAVVVVAAVAAVVGVPLGHQSGGCPDPFAAHLDWGKGGRACAGSRPHHPRHQPVTRHPGTVHQARHWPVCPPAGAGSAARVAAAGRRSTGQG